MSVRNAGTAIKEARLKAGLSQEKLSEGICSALSLSRIENGTAGVSPSTFQALMAHAGAPCEAFPIFASRTDFDCFYTLKRVRFYLDSWQLQEAYDELDKIEQKNFAENKFYYQEWLLLHCKLQFRSGCGDHAEIYDTLLDTLHISRPEIDFSDFRSLLLSLNEIELLIAFAQEALYLDKLEVCLNICMQISSYLENSQITFFEKDRLLAENAIVYAKYLIAIHDYTAALKVVTIPLDKMTISSDDSTRHELTFLNGLTLYYCGNFTEALIRFKTAFYSAHSIGSCYATVCRNYLLTTLSLSLPENLLSFPDITLTSYGTKKVIDTSDFSDGTYDLFSAETLTIGGLIRELRLEKKIPQSALCQGLCSKSKLSKIENNTLQPNVILAETLLQRLGISDAVFIFYSNDNEALLHDLRLRLILTPKNECEFIQNLIEQMKSLLSSDDKLYLQYILFKEATIESDPSKKIQLLLDALSITQPDIDLNFLPNCCFSLCEFNILNNLGLAYAKSATPSKATLMFFQLLNHINHIDIDILEKKRVLPILIGMTVLHLYKQGNFSELLKLFPNFTSTALKSDLYAIGNIFSHYSQALGECQQLPQALQAVYYAYYNLLIANSSSATLFKRIVWDDFNIDLE